MISIGRSATWGDRLRNPNIFTTIASNESRDPGQSTIRVVQSSLSLDEAFVFSYFLQLFELPQVYVPNV